MAYSKWRPEFATVEELYEVGAFDDDPLADPCGPEFVGIDEPGYGGWGDAEDLCRPADRVNKRNVGTSH